MLRKKIKLTVNKERKKNLPVVVKLTARSSQVTKKNSALKTGVIKLKMFWPFGFRLIFVVM